MVFISACHSEEIGKVFADAGVPIVICVQADLKISDEIAREFANLFYTMLLQGKSIKDAFRSTRKTISGTFHKKIFSCCCGHDH